MANIICLLYLYGILFITCGRIKKIAMTRTLQTNALKPIYKRHLIVMWVSTVFNNFALEN